LVRILLIAVILASPSERRNNTIAIRYKKKRLPYKLKMLNEPVRKVARFIKTLLRQPLKLL
jgi:hypothetical protein